MIKKMFGAVLLLLALAVSAAEKIVPAGTYGNLLQNGKLEILAGNFPGPWRNTEGRCTFVPESAPGGGGLFRIGKGKITVIRQDWTFTMTEKMLYRLSAKVRTSAGFKAESACVMVFNNGWTKTAPVHVTASADTGWRTISEVIAAPECPSGLYAVSVVTRNVTAGTVEFADIILEPATVESQEAQTAWLKDVPLRKLHLFGLRKGIRLANVPLSGRWYGKTPGKAEYSLDGKEFSAFAVDKNGDFTLPVSKTEPGKHLLKIRIDGKTTEYPFTVLASQTEKPLNNLNVQIGVFDLKSGAKASFTLAEERPVLFHMEPSTMTVTVDGGKKVLKSGQWIRLKEGIHTVTAAAAGKITVHRLADTIYYQLNNGPYLAGLPKNNVTFARKNLMGAVTVFFNPAISAERVATVIRPSGAIALAICPMSSFKKFNPANPALKLYDGVGVDEYSATSPKPLALHFTHRKNLKTHALKIWPWVTGSLYGNEIMTELQTCLCEAGDVMMYESYMKSNYKDEDSARKSVEQSFLNVRNTAEKGHPGFVHNLGMVTSHGNVPLSFTTDNNPAVDYKYFLDMQFNFWANDSAFRNLAAVGSWGGSYADRECNAWLAALFRHYVMEGKTEMLSGKYGFTFHPGILENCAFADGLKGWTVKGDAKAVVADNYNNILKRFGGIPADAENCAEMAKGSVLSQSLKNLKQGKLYRIRMLTTGEIPVITLKGVQEFADKKCTFFSSKKTAEKGTDIYFRADGKTGEIILTASKAKCTVHYLCATPCYEYNEVSEAEDKAERNDRLAKDVKSFLIRRNAPNGPGCFFENLKGAPVTGVSAEVSHDGKNLKMIFRSPAAEKGTWEVHSAADPAKGNLLLLSVDAQGKVQTKSVVRERGGMPTSKITPLADLASATVSEADGKQIITVMIPLEKIASFGFVPGRKSRMNFFYITDKQVAGWNPTFKKERRLPWRLGRAYLEK